jgi:hypothetical protein
VIRGYKDADPRTQELRRVLATAYGAEGKREEAFRDLSRAGLAWVYAAKAKSLDPTLKGVSADEQRARAVFDGLRRFFIGTKATDATGQNQGLAERVDAGLTSGLFKLNIRDMLLVTERKKVIREILDRAALQQQFGQAEAQALDLRIGLVTVECRLLEHAATRQGEETAEVLTSQYKAGIDMVPNPAYGEAEAEVRREEASVREAQAAAAAADRVASQFGAMGQMMGAVGGAAAVSTAEASLGNARANLARTPRLIPQDRIEAYNYKKWTAKVKARTQIDYQFIDNQKALVKEARTIQGEFEAEDLVIDGVKPTDVRGLRNDPLELPSDQEALRSSFDDAMKKLVEEVGRALAAYSDSRAEKAEQAAGTADEAGLESTIHYLVSCNERSSPRATAAESQLRARLRFSGLEERDVTMDGIAEEGVEAELAVGSALGGESRRAYDAAIKDARNAGDRRTKARPTGARSRRTPRSRSTSSRPSRSSSSRSAAPTSRRASMARRSCSRPRRSPAT